MTAPEAHSSSSAIVPTIERAIAAHQEERLMATPTYAVRCICGWSSDEEAFTAKRAAFRRHIAEAVAAALASGSSAVPR